MELFTFLHKYIVDTGMILLLSTVKGHFRSCLFLHKHKHWRGCQSLFLPLCRARISPYLLPDRKQEENCRQLQPEESRSCQCLIGVFFAVPAAPYVLLICYLYLTPALLPPLPATKLFAKERRGRKGLLLLGTRCVWWGWRKLNNTTLLLWKWEITGVDHWGLVNITFPLKKVKQ